MIKNFETPFKLGNWTCCECKTQLIRNMNHAKIKCHKCGAILILKMPNK